MSGRREPVLLVDDDHAVLKVCADALTRAGYAVSTAATGQEALQEFAGGEFSAAIVDLVLPDIDGLSLLSAFREADPDLIVVLMTGHASLDTAIDAVRRGAYDYLRKPFTATDLTRVLERGLSQRKLAVQNRDLLRELDQLNRDLQQKVNSASGELMAFISLGRKLDGAEGPLPVLLDLTRAAAQLTAATSAALFVLGEDNCLHCVVADGDAAAELQLPSSHGDLLLQRALRAAAPSIVPEFRTDPDLAEGPLALLGLSSAMVMPLTNVSGVGGVLALFDPPQPFTERQSALVKVIAAQAAEVVTLATLRQAATTASDDAFVDLQDLLGAS
ncbi:MAG: GAF domain-containing protein [Armatimonadota bacterium]